MSDLVEQLSIHLKEAGLRLATAESCTGGLIGAALTERAGSSHVFDRGFIVYSYESKNDILGVPKDVLLEHGAVSAEVAIAMARGALEKSEADISLSVTGIAGPGGGLPHKPVGLVYIGTGSRADNSFQSFEHHFKGDRSSVRRQTVEAALRHIMDLLRVIE